MMSLLQVKAILQAEHDRESFAKLIGKFYPWTDNRYKIIMRAYSTAKDAFRNKYRETGDRYFEHLRGTALILIEYLRVTDPHLISAMLLHDIVEDLNEWSHRRVIDEFGEETSEIIWWMTKPPIDGEFKTQAERDRFFNLQLATRAPRKPIMGKLVDRLHNTIELWSVDDEKRQRKIAETENFYLPLAVRENILIHELEEALDEIKNGHPPKRVRRTSRRGGT